MLENKNKALEINNAELSTELNIEELEQRLEMANSACTRCCAEVVIEK